MQLISKQITDFNISSLIEKADGESNETARTKHDSWDWKKVKGNPWFSFFVYGFCWVPSIMIFYGFPSDNRPYQNSLVVWGNRTRDLMIRYTDYWALENQWKYMKLWRYLKVTYFLHTNFTEISLVDNYPLTNNIVTFSLKWQSFIQLFQKLQYLLVLANNSSSVLATQIFKS